MSYEKARRHTIRASRKQANNHFGFSTLEPNERRRNPVLGGAWFAPGEDEARAVFIAQWHEKTAQMLLENPNLRIVD